MIEASETSESSATRDTRKARETTPSGPATLGARVVAWVSTGLFVALHVACLAVFFVPFTWKVFDLAVAGYVLRMGAITGGYHRYFAHRSYKTGRAFQFVLAFLGASAMQNGPLWWASVHRRHHRDTDGPRDPHSPREGLWHAHLGWFLSGRWNAIDLANVHDLAAFPELRWVERWSWLPIVAYATACFAIAGVPGLVWGFAISTVAVIHGTLVINSLSHVWGSQRYATGDTSRNNALLACITFGEGWHNNHHHFQSSARQGFFWWEIDLTYLVLRALASCGVISHLREPTPTALAGPLATPPTNGHPAAESPARPDHDAT